MLIAPPPSRAPAPEARRRFRIFVGVLLLIAVVALGLQLTGHTLLPGKTDTLWGFLVGLLAAFVFIEWRWSRTAETEASDTGTKQ